MVRKTSPFATSRTCWTCWMPFCRLRILKGWSWYFWFSSSYMSSHTRPGTRAKLAWLRLFSSTFISSMASSDGVTGGLQECSFSTTIRPPEETISLPLHPERFWGHDKYCVWTSVAARTGVLNVEQVVFVDHFEEWDAELYQRLRDTVVAASHVFYGLYMFIKCVDVQLVKVACVNQQPRLVWLIRFKPLYKCHPIMLWPLNYGGVNIQDRLYFSKHMRAVYLSDMFWDHIFIIMCLGI